jgi:hypothetical protein
MKIRYNKSAVTAIAVVSVAALSAVQAASANAATTHASTNSTVRIQRAFNVVGFNAAVARSHGYKIVTYANGSEQSVPINRASGLQPGPVVYLHRASSGVEPDAVTQNTVYGTCGSSFIEGEKSANHQIWLTSGFSVTPAPAVAEAWVIELEDENGTSYQGASGPIDSKKWSHTWDDLNQYNYSFDDVLTSSSATLSNGEVCTSGGPGIFLNGLGGT